MYESDNDAHGGEVDVTEVVDSCAKDNEDPNEIEIEGVNASPMSLS